ncbi:MAG: class I SAM-dependent methyltransferase [bacterium]
MRINTKDYYDDFAQRYDARRAHAYHRLVDRLELELLAPLVRDRRVVDVATGTGLTLCGLQELARHAVGIDLSRGMLRRARRRGLAVAQGTATALPLATHSCDVACCFKAFPHLTEPKAALAEMQRVVKPGGHVVVELYNPWSIRGLLRRRGPRRAISAAYHEGHVHTRYDTLAALERMLPTELVVEAVHGIRIVTAAGSLHSIPVLGALLGRLERWATGTPGLWRLAGFVVVTMRRTRDR